MLFVKKPKIVVILGPTASGKSSLAVKIAKKFNGEIISADSRQVYKGLDIGSGKITKKEMRGIPHHLLSVASPKRIFTVSQYQKLAKRALKGIVRRWKMPIVCGGTGLYIDALIYDYSFPEVAPNAVLRKRLEKLSTAQLFAKLKSFNLSRAQTIDKFNRRRLIRAIEIAQSKNSLVPFEKVSPYDVLKIGIKIDKETLEKKIKTRLVKRLRQGMIEEIQDLRYPKNGNGLSWQKLDNFGLEYRYISCYLREFIAKEEMNESIIKESLKYAKRQMTWFKRDKEIIWIENEKEALAAIKDFLPALSKKLE